jgi:LysR family hydrogen peroxide-inducible transcriptional activator
MEMHQVRYFLAVAQELNFTRAAETCHVSQPSLTRAIRLLEEELGGPLFHRERSNTHLSELGRSVLPNLQQVFSECANAKRIAKDFKQLSRATLKLGVMCTISPDRLVDLLSGIREKSPGIELQLTEASARELNDQLLEGELETAIYCLPDDEADERLSLKPRYKEQFMIVVDQAHAFVQKNAVQAIDLNGQPYLNRANCEYRGYAGDIFRAHGVSFTAVHRSVRDDWILALVASGLGFGFMPETCVQRTDVVARPLINPEFWREVNLVTVRGRPHSPAVSTLVREAARIKWQSPEPAHAN